MLIIIWPSKNNKSFLDRIKYEKILFLNKICDLKQIKEKKNILLINGLLLNEKGIIDEYNYFLEEVFISINITDVICINKNSKLEEICRFYKVNLINI